jgi:hypothetical protein
LRQSGIGLGNPLHFQCQNVGYFCGIGITLADRLGWVVLFEDVFCKFSFSAFAVMFIASSASICLSVSDDPHASVVEGEARSFRSTRHFSRILSMAESVVKYRPAIRSASNFPEAIIRLKAGPVIEPSGKANCAATSRRNGVVGVTVSGAGRFFTVVDHSTPGMKRPPRLAGPSAHLISRLHDFVPIPQGFFWTSRNQRS